MKEISSKFKIGDIVAMKDEVHFNPAYKTISVGRVESIHFSGGEGLFKNETVKRIVYNVSGFSLMPAEEELLYWEK